MIQDLGLRTPRLLTPNIFWKITTPTPFQCPSPPPSLNSWDRKLAVFPGGRQEARGGGWSMCWEGGLLSSPPAQGQLLRKESGAGGAMKVELMLGVGGGLDGEEEGPSCKAPKRS